MLHFRTWASMKKLSTWKSGGLVKDGTCHQSHPGKCGSLVGSIFILGFSEKTSMYLVKIIRQ